MVNRDYAVYKRRIIALEGMSDYRKEDAELKSQLEWDLICDIIICPTISDHHKCELLYRIATGKEFEDAED